MARCHPRNAGSAPSTPSAPTCSNSRNDQQPHVRLSSPRPRARHRPLNFVFTPRSTPELLVREYVAAYGRASSGVFVCRAKVTSGRLQIAALLKSGEEWLFFSQHTSFNPEIIDCAVPFSH